MRSSTEWHIEAGLPDVSELSWEVLMGAGEGALSEALRARRAELDRAATDSGLAEKTSLFANFAAPG